MAKSFIDKLFMPPRLVPEFSTKKYIDDLESGKFRNKFNLGVAEKDFDWYMSDFVQSPNCLYVGSMGSGKSKGANFTVMTWMLANMDQTVLFLVDPLKGATDYQVLFDEDSKGKKLYDQVYPVLSSEQMIKAMIDLLYEEAMARREIFNEIGAENITQYEAKTGKKMARVLTVMEEYHAIPYVILNFTADFKTELTPAHKYHVLMRIGRSYGLWFIACSQRSTKSDIPPEVTPNFIQKMVFRVARGEAQYLLGDAEAANIRPDQKGRCMTDYGAVQFPIMSEDTQSALLKKYKKKLTSECAYLTPDIIKDYLSGKSTKEQYRYKKLQDLVKSIESYNAELVVSLLHEKQGHIVETIDSKLNSFGISHIVHWNNDIKVAVMTRCSSAKGGKKISGKHISRLKKAMDLNECTHGVIYTSAEGLPGSLYKIATQLDIEVVDHEDMMKTAYKVDLEGENSKLSPDKLADDDKESGEYQEMYGKDENENFSHNDFNENDYGASELSDDTIIDLEQAETDRQQEQDSVTHQAAKNIGIDRLIGVDDESSQDYSVEDFEHDFEEEYKDSKEEEVDEDLIELEKELEKKKFEDAMNPDSKVTPTHLPPPSQSKEFLLTVPGKNKASKRIKVNNVVTIKKDESPSLLVHVQRNESNEIYRALFYIIDDKGIKHKYYVDKQVTGSFSFKEKQALGVSSIEEWNSQKEVLSHTDFNKKIIEYLQNFSSCSFPVHSICWKADEDFLKEFLVQFKFMISHSTIYENYLQSNFHMGGNRDQIIKEFAIKGVQQDLFSPIETDYRIWVSTN